MSILIFLIISYILLSITLKPVFEKAGITDSWKAYVPGLNFYVWTQIIGQPKWWALLLLVPIVNIFIFVGMAVDLTRSFGYFKLGHSALAVIYAPAMFYQIGKDKQAKYNGPIVPEESKYKEELKEARKKGDKKALLKLERSPYHKSGGREWIESIVFAVFAAAFIRMFLIEAYMIPTSSMEGSLLVGDHLFVSKANYGIRTPMTVLQIPLLHNTIPGTNLESYLEKPSLPYNRFFKWQSIQHNDPVVFNYPDGDSVYVFPDRTYSIMDYRTDRNLQQTVDRLNIPLKTRPIDKKDHYIKRCIGLPGDTLEIRDRQVYINGQSAENPENIQFTYLLIPNNGASINVSKLVEWGVNVYDVREGIAMNAFNLNQTQIDLIERTWPDVKVEIARRTPVPPGSYFPKDPNNFQNWDVDNFGPIWIPKAGETVSINAQNISLYRRVIGTYEGHDLNVKEGKVYIDGTEATEYTFEMDYYWMMGDNRHNSEDSRVWGFVPEDHIVGKPLFIWLSTKNGSLSNGLRWNRMFTSANKM